MATFTNQATLSYNGLTISSNIAVGEILEALEITKTATPDTYVPGDELTYVVALTNTGNTEISEITVIDDLGRYNLDNVGTVYPLEFLAGSLLYYVNGFLQDTPNIQAGPPMRITGITVPAGGNAIIVYRAGITEYAPLDADAQIVNTVRAQTNGDTRATASETVTAAGIANLDIAKSMSPTVVSNNDTITYTFDITNSGNTAADTTVVLCDTFNPTLSDITVRLNGVELVCGTQYTYNENTGKFKTVPGVITVPAAEFTQDPQTGVVTTVPGATTLTVTGTI